MFLVKEICIFEGCNYPYYNFNLNSNTFYLFIYLLFFHKKSPVSCSCLSVCRICPQALSYQESGRDPHQLAQCWQEWCALSHVRYASTLLFCPLLHHYLASHPFPLLIGVGAKHGCLQHSVYLLLTLHFILLQLNSAIQQMCLRFRK